MEELALLIAQVVMLGKVACCLISIVCVCWLCEKGIRILHFINELNQKFDDLDNILEDNKKTE